jgi:hypothetical protein
MKRLDMSTSDDWSVTKATVVSCRRAFLSGGIDETGGPASPTTYVVTFEYAVNDRKYSGKMKRGTPVTAGHHFEISSNPHASLAQYWL